MQQLEFDFHSPQERAIRHAFKIGFKRGTKCQSQDPTNIEHEVEHFMGQLKPLPENSNDENE